MEQEEELRMMKIKMTDLGYKIDKLECEAINMHFRLELLLKEIEKLKTGPKKKLTI